MVGQNMSFILSADKSVAVELHKILQHHFNYRLTIDCEAIKEAKEFEFLGVILNESLSFSKHITHLKSKCAKRTYFDHWQARPGHQTTNH